MSNENAAADEQRLEEEADRLFDEFAGEESTSEEPPADTDTLEPDEGDEEEGGQEGQPRDDQGRFAGDDGGQEGAQDDGQEGQEGQQESPEDELERLRQEAQQWQHRYQSDLGRQSALQRKIQELQEENQKLQQARQQSAGQGQAQEGQEGSDNPEGSGMSDNEWENLKKDFPEIARGFEQQLNHVTQQYESRIQQIESQLTPIQQQAYEQSMQAELQTLSERHPDYADYVIPPDVPVEQVGDKARQFHAWLQAQPEPVRKMMQSESAADAAYLLDNFKRDSGLNQQSDTDQKRRQRRLRSAQTVPSRGGRQRSEVPENDEDALFDYFANKADG